MRQSRFLSAGLLQISAAAVLWGTIGIATQAIYSTEPINSLFINLMRTLLATLILLPMAWRAFGTSLFNLPRRDLALMLFAGVILALSHACYFAAIRYAGVTVATLLTICTAPVLVSVVSAALKIEPFSGRLAIALIAAITGSVLLVGLNEDGTAHLNLPLGVLFAVLAAAAYGGMILCGRRLAGTYHPLHTTTLMFVAGSILLLLLNAASGITLPSSNSVWLIMLYLAVAPTALGYGLFHAGLRTTAATTASIVSMLDPVVAAGLAWILFNEVLSVPAIIGALFLLMGIGLLAATSHRTSDG
ncbi:MAG: EamA family transporter [Anaerolinea sp.]|nr:EamA family transporter [Anaerolinea sp.]